jgi:hypothetical protein
MGTSYQLHASADYPGKESHLVTDFQAGWASEVARTFRRNEKSHTFMLRDVRFLGHPASSLGTIPFWVVPFYVSYSIFQYYSCIILMYYVTFLHQDTPDCPLLTCGST